MLDLYIQITVALLLAFLLGFLVARMWVQNRQNEYIAKFTQLETKLNTEEDFRQQQTQRIELLQDREQALVDSMDELTSVKTTLNIEITALNKNTEEKKNEYLEKLTELETQLNLEEKAKQQQTHKIELLTNEKQQLIISVDELTLIKASLNKNLEDKENEYLENLIQLENKLNNEQQLISSINALNVVKNALDEEVDTLNKNLDEKQSKIEAIIATKDEIERRLEIAYADNNALTANLQLATEEQHFLNSQIQTLSENHQNTLKTVAFMEAQVSTSAIQQDQFQQSLQQSTQQYESMDDQINTLGINEKEALEKIHVIEKKYLGLQAENQSVEEEKTDYCDKLAIATHEKTELEARTLVKNHTLGAISVAIIPIPFIDLATLLGIQIKMLRALSEKYEIDFSENKVKSLVLPLLSSTLTMTGAIVFSSLIKIIPGIGQASGMVSVSILAGTTTYAMGEIFIEHFESGGTFLDFDVEKQKVRFRELYKKGKQKLVESEEEAS